MEQQQQQSERRIKHDESGSKIKVIKTEKSGKFKMIKWAQKQSWNKSVKHLEENKNIIWYD